MSHSGHAIDAVWQFVSSMVSRLLEAEVAYFDVEADAGSVRTQIILIRSSEPRSRPRDVPAKYACPCIKQSVGLASSTGMRISAVAFLRVQSPRSGVTAAEQIRMMAVSIVRFSALAPTRLARRLSMSKLLSKQTGFLVWREPSGLLCANGPLAESVWHQILRVLKCAGRRKRLVDVPPSSKRRHFS